MERMWGWFKVSESSDCGIILQDEGGKCRSMVLWQQCVKKSVQYEGGEREVIWHYGCAWDALAGTEIFQGSIQ